MVRAGPASVTGGRFGSGAIPCPGFFQPEPTGRAVDPVEYGSAPTPIGRTVAKGDACTGAPV